MTDWLCTVKFELRPKLTKLGCMRIFVYSKLLDLKGVKALLQPVRICATPFNMKIFKNTATRILSGTFALFFLASLVSCGTPQADETVTPAPDTEDVETATPSPSTESDTPGDSSEAPNSSTTELEPETEDVDTTDPETAGPESLDADSTTANSETTETADEETDVSSNPTSTTTGSTTSPNESSSTPATSTENSSGSEDSTSDYYGAIMDDAGFVPPEPDPDEIVNTEDLVYETKYTEEFQAEVASWVTYYINQYRVEEGAGELTTLPVQTLVAEYRADQLVDNYAHDEADTREARAYYQYGEWRDATLFGDDASKSYYGGDLNEAIGRCTAFSKSATAEDIGRTVASGIHNSSGHWSYVGGSRYSYVGVGIEYNPSSAYQWYVCVIVSAENYG